MAAAVDNARRRASMGAAMWGCVRLGLLAALVGLVLVSGAEVNASPGTTQRVSVSSAGVQGTGDSGAWGRPAISSDGRFVAFESFATNLVSPDTNNASDIFVRDRRMGTTSRVSVATSGGQATGFSFQPAISSDGRYVAFDSDAPDLVSGDGNGASDIFVRDRRMGTTSRVSVATGGGQATGSSFQPAISGDGRYVAFYSDAPDLVSGDGNGAEDVFVRDRQAGVTERVSVDSGGNEGHGASSDAAISGDGRFVAFYSEAPDLVLGDGNGYGDILVHDRQTGATTRVSVSSAGDEGDGGSYHPSISAEGRYVAFFSAATILVDEDTNGYTDVFVRDRDTDGDGIFDEAGSVSTILVSVDSGGDEGDGASSDVAISGDGRFVAFYSEAPDLVLGDGNGYGDIFVRDCLTATTTRVSVSSAGEQAEGGSSTAPAVSPDGRYVAFYSRASNLVSWDTNDRQDVFVHDRLAAVGGVAELPDVSGPSAPNYTPLAGLSAVSLALLAAGAWYARRRSRQG